MGAPISQHISQHLKRIRGRLLSSREGERHQRLSLTYYNVVIIYCHVDSCLVRAILSRKATRIPDPVDSSGPVVRDHKRAVPCRRARRRDRTGCRRRGSRTGRRCRRSRGSSRDPRYPGRASARGGDAGGSRTAQMRARGVAQRGVRVLRHHHVEAVRGLALVDREPGRQGRVWS